jgi:membrane-associated phospholipid phosphatase
MAADPPRNEGPMTDTSAPEATILRAVKWMRLIIAASIGLTLAMAMPCTAQTAEAQQAEWWKGSMAIDYGVIGAAAGGWFALTKAAPPGGSGIGPSFDPKNPSAILDSSLSDRIGKPHLLEVKGETVPTHTVAYAIAPVAGWLLLQEGLAAQRDGEPRGLRLHETGVGLAEALALNLLTTEVLKVSVGRLRPDFQDRVRRFYCQKADHQGVSCTGSEVPLDDDPAKAQKLLDDGRKSFPSGHSSTSFALATYAALATGGRFVWGADATAGSRAAGIGAQLAALGLAGWVAWTRVDDGRHNVSDVLTGAAIGTVFANIAYWRRFDTEGSVRRKPTAASSADPGVVLGPMTLALSWGF